MVAHCAAAMVCYSGSGSTTQTEGIHRKLAPILYLRLLQPPKTHVRNPTASMYAHFSIASIVCWHFRVEGPRSGQLGTVAAARQQQ